MLRVFIWGLSQNKSLLIALFIVLKIKNE